MDILRIQTQIVSYYERICNSHRIWTQLSIKDQPVIPKVTFIRWHSNMDHYDKQCYSSIRFYTVSESTLRIRSQRKLPPTLSDRDISFTLKLLNQYYYSDLSIPIDELLRNMLMSNQKHIVIQMSEMRTHNLSLDGRCFYDFGHTSPIMNT